MRGFLLFLLIAAAPPSLAAEFDCPLRWPSNPHLSLVRAEPQIDGANVGRPPDIDERQGEIEHYANLYDHWNTRRGALLCVYEGGGEVTVPVAGILLRCDWRKRHPRKGPEVIERIWCTSRD